MKKFLLWFRYYLEILAVPAFAFLVIHLAGHGIMMMLDGSHEHVHEHAHGETHGFEVSEIIHSFFTVEVLSGILFFLLFIWIWHRPMMKKLVPCSHDHCHGDFSISHVFAIGALCFHFFPEAGVRHELLHGMMEGKMLNMLALIGFLAHFFVDLVIAVLLSSYWKTRWGFWISFLTIVSVWILAFFVAESVMAWIPHSLEGVVFLVSAFLLAMFVHRPHVPVLECPKCKE